MNNKPWVIVAILILLAANLFLVLSYLNLSREAAGCRQIISGRQTSEKVANFASLVVDKVLKAQGEVSFDDRLQLENAVRDTKDVQLLTQWKKFTDSQNETEAQMEMKNLLGVLVNKMQSK